MVEAGNEDTRGESLSRTWMIFCFGKASTCSNAPSSPPPLVHDCLVAESAFTASMKSPRTCTDGPRGSRVVSHFNSHPAGSQVRSVACTGAPARATHVGAGGEADGFASVPPITVCDASPLARSSSCAGGRVHTGRTAAWSVTKITASSGQPPALPTRLRDSRSIDTATWPSAGWDEATKARKKAVRVKFMDVAAVAPKSWQVRARYRSCASVATMRQCST